MVSGSSAWVFRLFTPYCNWPYTFGLLFGIGLYARYLDDPERFRSGYDDLLGSSHV